MKIMEPPFRLAILCILCCLMQGVVFAATSERQLTHTEEPVCPEIVKASHITGVVKLQVVVSPVGTVTKVTLLGGNPMLAEPAIRAVQHWKYAAADSESLLTVEVRFNQ